MFKSLYLLEVPLNQITDYRDVLRRRRNIHKKCSSCGKEFPEGALKKMVQIINRKAYLNILCPACQAITRNNSNYYYPEEK